MEATSSTDTEALSQDSGYASQPHSSCTVTKYRGQNIRITACANQGGRKYMEDRVHVHVQRCALTGAVDWTYVAVYDGHGGSEASEYCRQHLLNNIQAEKNFDSENDDEFLEAIKSGFLQTHHTMWEEVDTWDRTDSGHQSVAGTTASCAFIRRGKLYVGHVGDSAILLTTRSHPDKFARLTVDHKPESNVEKKRIVASGGQVMKKSSVYRVVWTRTTLGRVGRGTPSLQIVPLLSIARSLGDFWSYVEETKEFAVSPIPDVSVIVLTPDHYSIVLATDGLTNVVSPRLESAVMYELAAEEQQRRVTNDEPPNPARILMRKTLLAWGKYRADNVSVVSVIFDDESSRSIEEEEGNGRDEGTINWTSDLPVEVPKETSLNEQLVEYPLCMMHVTNDKLVRYQTAPVVMRCDGRLDDEFCGLRLTGSTIDDGILNSISSRLGGSGFRLARFGVWLGEESVRVFQGARAQAGTVLRPTRCREERRNARESAPAHLPAQPHQQPRRSGASREGDGGWSDEASRLLQSAQLPLLLLFPLLPLPLLLFPLLPLLSRPSHAQDGAACGGHAARLDRLANTKQSRGDTSIQSLCPFWLSQAAPSRRPAARQDLASCGRDEPVKRFRLWGMLKKWWLGD